MFGTFCQKSGSDAKIQICLSAMEQTVGFESVCASWLQLNAVNN